MTRATSVTDEEAASAVRTLLEYVGERPQRDGLRNTPQRLARALREMTVGYDQDPQKILSTMFDSRNEEGGGVYSGIAMLRDIAFSSLCEHHLLPFVGHFHVAYIPGASGRIVGISKLARVVEVYSKRLQVQERLTQQVAEALEKALSPIGVLVVVNAEHHCMRLRGVCKAGVSMTTSEVRGVFKASDAARSEAMQMLMLGGRS